MSGLLALFQAREDWALRGACNGLATRDVDPWCPDEELPRREREYLYAKARRVCAGCPVMMDCAADALANLAKVDELAMRGGMTPHELQQVARKLGLPHRREAQHGTRSRYTGGCDAGADGKACEPCKRAHREYEHERRLQARARKVRFAVLAQPLGRGKRRADVGQMLLFTDGLPAAWITMGETDGKPTEAEPQPGRAGAVLAESA